MHDYDRLASLFTPDGAWRIPYVNVEHVSREEIRAGFVQTGDQIPRHHCAGGLGAR